MRKYMSSKIFLASLTVLSFSLPTMAQDTAWTYENCLNYALGQNIAIRQAELNVQQGEVNYLQSKSNRLPSVSASAAYDYSLGKPYSSLDKTYSGYDGTNSTSYSISSNLNLYNGHKLAAQIEQSELNWQGEKYYSERVKESVELSILNAYLQILYAQEAVSNSQKQIDATQEQLKLSEARLDLGIISRSDYLQVKSELAREKLSLANANRTLTMAKVTLMQLMELPVKEGFAVVSPDLDAQISVVPDVATDTIFNMALGVKTQIKEAEIKVKSVMLNEKIARADRMPSLSLSTGISTGWSDNLSAVNYSTQVGNRVTPYAGVKLTIPIFQKYQVRSNITTAKIALNQAQLAEIDTRNSLRKDVEQAVADVVSAQANYEASMEQYDAAKESYAVAAEKFESGIVNTIDLMTIKNNMILAESNLVQARYNLLFSIKIIEFYKGNPISLTK